MLPRARLRLIRGLALVAAIVSLILLCVRPDIERYLKENVGSDSMPDAFLGLNGTMTIFMFFVTATLLLVFNIESKRQYGLLIPLLLGPVACLTGWCLMENFNDPNWFHLFALTTIGMLVSCTVTTLLLTASKRIAEPSLDERV